MRVFDTPQPITVDLDLGIGSVRILASDRSDATVDIRPRDEASAADRKAVTQVRLELTGRTLSVSALKTWRRFTPINDGAIVVTIEVPTGSSVKGHTDMGDFYADGQLGDCRFKSAMGRLRLEQAHELSLATSFGEVTVDECTESAELATGSGRVSIRRIAGAGVVKNSNGDTWVGDVGGDLRVKSANGDIVVEHARASVTAKTATGSVRLSEVVTGQVEARSAAGDIEIGVRDGSAAWLDLGAAYGTVRNALTPGEPAQRSDRTVEIRATTAYGDVVISRVPSSDVRDPAEQSEEEGS